MAATIARGVRAPIIREGDDIVKITADCVEQAMREDGFSLSDRDVVAVTEAVVARAAGNYASVDDIATDVSAKLPGGTVGVVFPILSRNRLRSVCAALRAARKRSWCSSAIPRTRLETICSIRTCWTTAA